MGNSISELDGFSVGHWTDYDSGTGCTVVLCPEGAVAGVDVRGGAPGTRETDLLSPTCMIDRVHAVLLSGGSAYGLAAADGVMRWLEQRGFGYQTGVAVVPIVPAAIIFDLPLGRADVRPGPDAGYAACEAATVGPVVEGCVGVGTGATVGKALGFAQATKSGIGAASRTIGGSPEQSGVCVSAIVVVNALGDVVDPSTCATLAGARQLGTNTFVNSQSILESTLAQMVDEWRGGNTTLGVIATNASLTKVGATKVAQMAHDGLARTIRPVHTMHDGDTLFVLSNGELQADPGILGAIAADVVAEAVTRAVYTATSLHGIPALCDL